MTSAYLKHLQQTLEQIKADGLYKKERIIASPQDREITLSDGQKVLNMCSNNYLGLADHPDLIAEGKKALDQYGFGMSSVRFICGTQTVHKKLESELSAFFTTDDTILYSSCFDANGGLFETLLGPEDAVISDALNHASIIDGVRLCKAKRFRYNNNDMADLEQKLSEAASCRFRLIATDGVFSMDGILANLPEICRLAEKWDALVMVDDSHAVGFIGKTGAGTPEFYGLQDKIDIITGTLGKALGGASGGYTSGRKEIVELLRQRSRPYLFSNTLCPMIASASIKVLHMLKASDKLRETLHTNAAYFRKGLKSLGFELIGAGAPIIPVMLGEASLALEFAKEMLKKGVYVIGFCYPVVPLGKARIRTQISAAHSIKDLDHALSAFEETGKALNII